MWWRRHPVSAVTQALFSHSKCTLFSPNHAFPHHSGIISTCRTYGFFVRPNLVSNSPHVLLSSIDTDGLQKAGFFRWKYLPPRSPGLFTLPPSEPCCSSPPSLSLPPWLLRAPTRGLMV
ncbi:hypothetical protein CPB85DRAFT_201694 [Mucidula mucida]|nr:hypothetical protein CPB85DRAFT_201694 [Mucidula mucida]